MRLPGEQPGAKLGSVTSVAFYAIAFGFSFSYPWAQSPITMGSILGRLLLGWFLGLFPPPVEPVAEECTCLGHNTHSGVPMASSLQCHSRHLAGFLLSSVLLPLLLAVPLEEPLPVSHCTSIRSASKEANLKQHLSSWLCHKFASRLGWVIASPGNESLNYILSQVF